ncbi:MAG TPA: hypothetical protein VNL36_08400, partial [Bacteroidota bacterium]|nr:hypothetical protein [Bacteroidota bacterium]
MTVSTSPVETYVQRGGDGSIRPKVKKIPPELRRKKINFSLEPVWYKRLLWRLREDSQFLR